MANIKELLKDINDSLCYSSQDPLYKKSFIISSYIMTGLVCTLPMMFAGESVLESKINDTMTDGTKKAAVLMSCNGPEVPILTTVIGIQGDVDSHYTAQNTRTQWRYCATREDLREAIADPNIDSIALIGHMSRSTWYATDGDVIGYDLRDLMDVPKKKGEAWMIGCGKPYGMPLLQPFMKDKRKVYGAKNKQNMLSLKLGGTRKRLDHNWQRR